MRNLNISIFASGTGSNFEAILKAKKKGLIKSTIALLITNNSQCGAVEIARKNSIDVVHISRKVYPELSEEKYTEIFLNVLKTYNIDFIVLAGYMKLLPPSLVDEYENRIINIHPALLPSFGGKGMYGINVHRAVLESGVKVTGITIHFVNKEYDKGRIIFQKCVEIYPDDDEYSLQKRVLKYEHKYYPLIISELEKHLL
ncbi:MAG: phosphoribosylglycinamide formyltransferase [Ignavibacteria bacterium]|nr:phosphoribosylglycinamide formyltransferase [Ignavibacteria bacterium]